MRASGAIEVVAAALGINTMLWLTSGPIQLGENQVRLWGNATTVSTLGLLLGTCSAIALFPKQQRRGWWLAFAIFAGPFAPWCYWAFGVDSSTKTRFRQIMVTSFVAGVVSYLIASAPSTPDRVMRAFVAAIEIAGVWGATSVSEGRTFVPVLIAFVALVIAKLLIP